MQSASCKILGWMNHMLESRLLGEISTTSDADDNTLIAKCEEELKSLLMRVKEESEKAGLILSIQTEGEKMEAVTDFIFLGFKITGW